jgi:hypothetical protein
MTDELENAPTDFADKVKERAAVCLQTLLQELEFRHGESDYEVEYVGDLYARMIVAVYMGFQPKLLANDAEESAFKLMELTGIEMEEVEADDAD